MTDEVTTDKLTLQQGEDLYDNMRILAQDQVSSEAKIASLERNQKVIFIGIAVSIAGTGILFKTVTTLMKGMQQIGMIVQSMQEGLPSQGGGTPGPVDRPHRPTVSRHDFTPPEPPTESRTEGDTWDPGPQDLPDEVKEALAEDRVSAEEVHGMPTEADYQALLDQEPVPEEVHDRSKHNAGKPSQRPGG